MQGQTSRKILDRRLQRKLRNAPTDAEIALWQYLRGRQVAGCKFRRQHPFGDYILDFACLKGKLVVELDGSQHGLAAHVARDAERDRRLGADGYRVLRFWNGEVDRNLVGVLDTILDTLGVLGTPPTGLRPVPPPRSGEG